MTTAEIMKKKYFICIGNGSDLIPEAEHIERNDELCEKLGITDDYSDFDAAQDAAEDGIKLICDIDGIYPNFYLDTEKNREVITKFFKTNTYSIDDANCYHYKSTD